MKKHQHEINAALDRLLHLVATRRSELAGMRGEALADWLYLHWYVTPAVPFDRSDYIRANADGTDSTTPHQTVGALLRAALESAQHWEDGWVALEVAAGQTVLAGRGAQRRWLSTGDHANLSRPGAPVAPGDGLATFGLLSWVDAPTTFQGLRHWRAEPAGALVRFYLSVGLPALPQVLRALVQTLEQPLHGGPLRWSLKCPSQAAGFGRVDSLVVYVERAQWRQAQDVMVDLAGKIAPLLRDATPPLTQPLGRGVAFAHDPQNLQSFGQSRCLALASAVQSHLETASCPSHGPRHLSRRALKAALRRAGIDSNLPWVCEPAASTSSLKPTPEAITQ